MAYALAAISILALAYAAKVVCSMIAERNANLDRIARATRPQHGKAMPKPVRNYYDRPGE